MDKDQIWAFVDLKHHAVPFVGDRKFVEDKLETIVKACAADASALDDCEKYVFLVSSEDVSEEAMREMVDKRTIPLEVKEKLT